MGQRGGVGWGSNNLGCFAGRGGVEQPGLVWSQMKSAYKSNLGCFNTHTHPTHKHPCETTVHRRHTHTHTHTHTVVRLKPMSALAADKTNPGGHRQTRNVHLNSLRLCRHLPHPSPTSQRTQGSSLTCGRRFLAAQHAPNSERRSPSEAPPNRQDVCDAHQGVAAHVHVTHAGVSVEHAQDLQESQASEHWGPLCTHLTRGENEETVDKHVKHFCCCNV